MSDIEYVTPPGITALYRMVVMTFLNPRLGEISLMALESAAVSLYAQALSGDPDLFVVVA